MKEKLKMETGFFGRSIRYLDLLLGNCLRVTSSIYITL
jgi:hypothetical protein